MELHNAHSRTVLNINQEEQESKQPSYANFSANLEKVPNFWVVSYDLGVTDHQGPTKRLLR